MTYELIDFLARLQVAATTRMVQEHAEQQAIQRALDNEPALDDEPKLQKIGRNRATKKRRTHMELPELNMALVETYRELDHEHARLRIWPQTFKLLVNRPK